MGFGDKFKGITQQAKEKVAENRERIQEAVDAASVAANEKTHGKYANKIMKVSQKTGGALDKFGTGADAGSAAGDHADSAAAAPEQQPSGSVDDMPSFADEAPAPTTSEPNLDATTQPTGGWPTTGEAPKFGDEL